MILTIAHTKGGVGKSTLVWHLAHSLHGCRVAIVDLDFQQTLHYVNLMAGGRFTVVQPADSDGLIDWISSNAAQYDFVLIDVGGFDNDTNRTAIRYSHRVLIPISDSVTEVLGFETFKGILQTLDTSADFHIVLNNIHPLTRNFDTIREAVSGTNIRVCDTIVRNRKAYKTTMGNGKSIFDTLEGANARTEIEQLRDELTQGVYHEPR